MLDKYKSMCQERQKIIVSRDQGAARVHQARNVDSDLVRHYQIDGYVICDPSVRKCDFLLLDDTKKKAYLIEVKGTDIKHAVGQLENTERILKSDLEGYQREFRIVYRANTHGVHSPEYTKFCLRHQGCVKAKTDLLEEAI